jgi:hypothetical protein
MHAIRRILYFHEQYPLSCRDAERIDAVTVEGEDIGTSQL